MLACGCSRKEHCTRRRCGGGVFTLTCVFCCNIPTTSCNTNISACGKIQFKQIINFVSFLDKIMSLSYPCHGDAIFKVCEIFGILEADLLRLTINKFNWLTFELNDDWLKSRSKFQVSGYTHQFYH